MNIQHLEKISLGGCLKSLAIVGIASIMGLLNPQAVVAAPTFNVLHSFDKANGATPTRGVTQGSDGSFYGTTYEGGQFNGGTVYKLDTNSSFSVLHNFAFDPTNHVYGHPDSGITILADGSLIGATTDYSSMVAASVFKIDINGAISYLNQFGYHIVPHGQLALGSDGSLFGVANEEFIGGDLIRGFVYKIDPNGKGSTLYRFKCALNDLNCLPEYWGLDGRFPEEGVTLDIKGNLYGTTSDGGSFETSRGGVVFKINTSGNYSIVRSFDDLAYGKQPSSRVIVAGDGSLYGTTALGGSYNAGVVYKIDPSGVYSVVHNFDNAKGGKPTDIIRGKDGSLYGTTAAGGQSGVGIVFKLDPNGVFSVIHNFDNTGGAEPNGILLGRDGNLYGTSAKGGQYGFGTVFSIKFGLVDPCKIAPQLCNKKFCKLHPNDVRCIDICKIRPDLCNQKVICKGLGCFIMEDKRFWRINPPDIIAILCLPMLIWSLGRNFGGEYQTYTGRVFIAATSLAIVILGRTMGSWLVIVSAAASIAGVILKRDVSKRE